jgi:hypothetical protein
LNNVDWIVNNDTVKFEDRMKNIDKWTAEINETLQNGGIQKNLKKLKNLVRERYSLKEGEDAKASKYLKMIPTRDINSYAKDSAKSFTEVTNVVKFSSKYVPNAGDIESGKNWSNLVWIFSC